MFQMEIYNISSFPIAIILLFVALLIVTIWLIVKGRKG
jgi:hypothetical protein